MSAVVSQRDAVSAGRADTVSKRGGRAVWVDVFNTFL